ncbi:hypothetical protein LJC32_01660 [Oscillospiraceae bacterium OttesenSCG-928-F05]|nr:hypothetical protein [Oscillospiraceae bacterium OttesenSCG-928-F05]
MKQGRFFMGILTLLCAAAVILYMGFNIVSAVSNPPRTAEAILYTAEETATVHGYVVRKESLVENTGDGMEILVAEGEKVAAGEALSRRFAGENVLPATKALASVEDRLAQLESARAKSSGTVDAVRTEKAISEAVFSLASYMARGEFSTIDTVTANLKTHIFTRDFIFSSGSATAAADEEIARLKAEQTSLSASVESATVSVYAPWSGFFTRVVDGYESVLTEERAKTLTAGEINNLEEERVSFAPELYTGKLIRSFRWTYVGVLPAEAAEGIAKGDILTLRFPSERIGEVNARVERVTPDEGGETVIVLSSSEKMREMTSVRQQNVDIILSSYTGIRVPAEAIRVTEEGTMGVFCSVVMQARFFEVERLFEQSGYYIVAYDPADKNGLRPGDEIIVRSKDLYDGKILQN